MTRGAAVALGAVGVAIFVLACSDAAVQEGDAPAENPPAPAFEHPDLDGNPVRLADLRGKTVVIDFWATWCAPCVFQPPALNQVWQAHRAGGDVVVLGMEVGGASADEVRAWGEENDAVAEYPILLGADEDLARRYGAMGFPALVVIDPQGGIASLHLGLSTAEEVEAAIALVAGS